MRWPGTIQPSRFLSHTGHVMPGVRRVVTAKEPTPGNGWTIQVPAGVMWWVESATFNLAASATAGSRYVTINATIEGVDVWAGLSQAAQAPSTTGYYSFTSSVANPPASTEAFVYMLPFPDLVLPSGGSMRAGTSGGAAGDQMSSCVMYVEEYYFTDAQLSEDARLHAELEHDIAVYEYEQAEQTRGGA